MASPSLWTRLRKSRVVQVLAVYLGAAWVVLQVTNDLQQALELPAWVPGAAVVLLLVGLVITLATAWIQSRPGVAELAARDEVPDGWELELGDLGRTLRQGRLPHLTWARALVAGVVAFSLLFGLAGAYVLFHGTGASPLSPSPASAAEAPDGIAVLPFEVRGQGLGSWREGMVDVLSTGLDGAGGLRAISSRTVLARWNELAPDTSGVDAATALGVARRTGARYALLGSAVALGPTVRLVADVYALDGDRRLGEAQVEGAPDSVMGLVDRLAAKTLGLILNRPDGELPHVDLASVTTSSLPALKAYLQGEVRFRRGDFAAAADAYQRAVREDSLFALAYYRLSQARDWSEGAGSERGAEAMDRAAALADRMPERERLLVRTSEKIHERDPAAATLARRATKTYPEDPEAWYQMGESYMHVLSTMGSWDDAADAFGRAVQLAPRFAPYRIHLLDEAIQRYADSAMTAHRLVAYERLAPSSPTGEIYRLASALAFGAPAVRDSALETVPTLSWTQQREIQQILSDPRKTRVDSMLVARLMASAPQERQGRLWSWVFQRRFFQEGRLRAGLAAMARSGATSQDRNDLIMGYSTLGVDLPDSLVREVASLDVTRAPPDEVPSIALFAATRGRWKRYDAARTRLRRELDSAEAAGDTAAVTRARGALKTARSLGLWKRGRLQPALALMDSVRRHGGYGQAPFFWMGLMHEQAGQLEDAETDFLALQRWHPDPLPSYYLGRVDARLGKKEAARKWLTLFVRSWAEGDAEVQPLVRDARRILDGLGRSEDSSAEPAVGQASG